MLAVHANVARRRQKRQREKQGLGKYILPLYLEVDVELCKSYVDSTFVLS